MSRILLHPRQSEVYRDLFVDREHRNVVVCCNRGWGKSHLGAAAAVTACYELMELNERVPNKNVWIVAPTYDQVMDIYYPLLHHDFGLSEICIKSSRDDGRFVLPRRVELRLLSFEAVERMRGKGCYFLVWDEVSSCTKGLSQKDAWQGVMQPAIITRWSKHRAATLGARSPGRMLAISTPKGYNFFYDMYCYSETDPEWGRYHYDYTQSPMTEIEEIEHLKATVDPIEFASEYMASFRESGASVFYCFDRNVHVRDDIEYFAPPSGPDKDDGEDVHVCIDFNVGLQCSSFFAMRGKQVHFLDEFKGHPDTESLALSIREKFEGHRIYAYPDPTGRQRKSSAPVGRTDFSILRECGIQVLARDRSPPIVDSAAAVNRMLMTATGEVSMYVRPECRGLIESLERTKWVDNRPDTASIDKSEGIEHFSDGVRYAMEFKFPVQAGRRPVARGFRF